MPLLELPHWLMIAEAPLVMAEFIGLALRRKDEVDTDAVLLPGDLASWKPQQPPTSSGPASKTKKPRLRSAPTERRANGL
jgi:hypothetical protein